MPSLSGYLGVFSAAMGIGSCTFGWSAVLRMWKWQRENM